MVKGLYNLLGMKIPYLLTFNKLYHGLIEIYLKKLMIWDLGKAVHSIALVHIVGHYYNSTLSNKSEFSYYFIMIFSASVLVVILVLLLSFCEYETLINGEGIAHY